MADDQEIKPSKHPTGCYPFTPAPEEPAPEHSNPVDTTEEVDESDSGTESISELLKSHSHQSAPTMAEQDSIKVSIEPLNDTNFTTWHIKDWTNTFLKTLPHVLVRPITTTRREEPPHTSDSILMKTTPIGLSGMTTRHTSQKSYGTPSTPTTPPNHWRTPPTSGISYQTFVLARTT
jgi:hypothetical protein